MKLDMNTMTLETIPPSYVVNPHLEWHHYDGHAYFFIEQNAT